MTRFASIFLANSLLASVALAQAPAPMQPAQPVIPAAIAPVASVGLSRVFDEADTNRDGTVTREEFLAKAAHHFDIADANRDNQITREEMETQQNLMLQGMFKRSGNWQQKLQGMMGSVASPTAPSAPTVPAPTGPTY